MKPIYERTLLSITEIRLQDVIATSAASGSSGSSDSGTTETPDAMTDNAFGNFGSYEKLPGNWF